MSISRRGLFGLLPGLAFFREAPQVTKPLSFYTSNILRKAAAAYRAQGLRRLREKMNFPIASCGKTITWRRPMKSLILILLLTATPSLCQNKGTTRGKTSPKPKAPAVEQYDPDKLPPGEVACGRLGSARSAPCECMKHRVKIRDEQQAKCLELVDRKARIECASKIDRCPAVVDAEQANWTLNEEGAPMPAQCRRSCKLAKCECCHS